MLLQARRARALSAGDADTLGTSSCHPSPCLSKWETPGHTHTHTHHHHHHNPPITRTRAPTNSYPNSLNLCSIFEVPDTNTCQPARSSMHFNAAAKWCGGMDYGHDCNVFVCADNTCSAAGTNTSTSTISAEAANPPSAPTRLLRDGLDITTSKGHTPLYLAARGGSLCGLRPWHARTCVCAWACVCWKGCACARGVYLQSAPLVTGAWSSCGVAFWGISHHCCGMHTVTSVPL